MPTLLRTLSLSALFLSALAAPALGSVVARERVTLGHLTDDSDAVVVATVQAATPRVVLSVEEVLTGPGSLQRAELEPGEHVKLRAGQRALFFLRRDKGATFRPLVTEYQRILLRDATQERDLVAAVRTRIPTLGTPRDVASDLYAQLDSLQGRIREDAAWDLLRFRKHTPSATQRGQLLAALRRAPTIPLLRLCKRFPSSDMLQPALDVARRSQGDLREEAAGALEEIDPGATVAALRIELGQGNRASGLSATGIASALHDSEATDVLTLALGHTEEEVRLQAVRGLAERELSGVQLASLELAAWNPNSRRVSSAAVAALALAGSGAVLKRIADHHPDPELRRLATALRRDPVRVGRPFLR